MTIVLTTERSQIAICFRSFSAVFNCCSLFNEAAYLAAFAISDANLKQSKTKNYEKNHLLLQILAVLSRYGPHLMIVMIFVTKITFKMVQEFLTASLDFSTLTSKSKYLATEIK